MRQSGSVDYGHGVFYRRVRASNDDAFCIGTHACAKALDAHVSGSMEFVDRCVCKSHVGQAKTRVVLSGLVLQ